MRTSVLATLLGLSLVACAGNISGGGGDDDVPETCGNGAVDPGEDCDGGEGCSATCTTIAVPRLDISVDKPTIATELGTTNMVTVTLTSSGGFTGSVPVAATLVDGAGAAIADWIVAVNPPTVTVPADGTATAVVTFAVPTLKSALTGTLKIATTPTGAEGGTTTFDSQITVADQVTVMMKLDANGQCEYPAAGTIQLKVGSKIRWFNNELAGGSKITIHSNGINGQNTGVNHQGDPGSDPQTAYEQTTSVVGQSQWYCHAPGPTVNGLNIQTTN